MVVRRIRPARRVFHTRPCVGKAVLTIQIDAIKQAPWFTAPWFPFAVLHPDLRIVAINPAFEVTTHQPRAALVGRSALTAFPENPADPDVDLWEAVAWAATTGAAVALAKMYAQRRAASYYFKSTGALPPPLRKD